MAAKSGSVLTLCGVDLQDVECGVAVAYSREHLGVHLQRLDIGPDRLVALGQVCAPALEVFVFVACEAYLFARHGAVLPSGVPPPTANRDTPASLGVGGACATADGATDSDIDDVGLSHDRSEPTVRPSTAQTSVEDQSTPGARQSEATRRNLRHSDEVPRQTGGEHRANQPSCFTIRCRRSSRTSEPNGTVTGSTHGAPDCCSTFLNARSPPNTFTSALASGISRAQ